MAFDNSTRNRLQRLVSDCRDLLTREFDAKLQELYGIYAGEGRVLNLEKLPHLDDEKLRVATLLRQRIQYLASGGGIGEAVKRVLREQAFTVLNRFAALRMAEERGIIVESVGGGLNSKGFKTFSEVSYSGLGSAYERYRVFLGCMFDEMATDLGVLFDRQSPYGLLFPRENVLLELFERLNTREVKPLWKEDETIGWIYQYFNDEAERKKMRKESAAPRNSRELAVRNQFFTPRYVVEFLTDNTLCRIWYEMTQGETKLKEQCRYLRRPNEIFLKPGENSPTPITPNAAKESPSPPSEGVEGRGEVGSSLSQEDLLKQPVHIPHRPLKDPRTILMLDPACGSMHFGLYAFDLFEVIYDEAWALEEKLGADALSRPPGMKSLNATYAGKAAFLKDVPRLIIEHNLHGIDIDPRCAQIAGLSLWLRAQKAWQRLGLKLTERPAIKRSNIVCAEPMPGEKELLREFVERGFPAEERGIFLRLLEAIFDKMQLAGEAGSLLKIEEEIRSAISEAKKLWKEGPKLEQSKLLARLEPAKQKELKIDLSGITDEQFWDGAESRIYDALRDYAEQVEDGGGFQRRLFAEDAARGFAFIDVCRKRYDVALMNPPFGQFSKAWKAQAKEAYPSSYSDLLAAFTDSFLHRIHSRGRLGAITSRTCFFLSSFTDWRNNVILAESAVSVVADLGQGVMDNAMVEAAAYVMEREGPEAIIPFIRAITEPDRETLLSACIQALNSGVSKPALLLARQDTFQKLPGAPFVYWVSDEDLKCFGKLAKFEPHVGLVRQGLSTSDNPRFVRTTWEVAAEDTILLYYPANSDDFCWLDDPVVESYKRRRSFGTPRWAFHVLSGSSQPWYSPITVMVNLARNGAELASFRSDAGRQKGVLRNSFFYHRPGFSWTRRAARFYPYLIPGNCVASASRYMAFPNKGREYEALAISASRVASAFLRFYGEMFERPNFLVETLKMLPWPALDEETIRRFRSHVVGEVERRRQAYMNHEPFHEFVLPAKVRDFSNAGRSLAFDATSLLSDNGERRVEESYGFDILAADRVERDLLEALAFQGGDSACGETTEDEDHDDAGDFLLDYSESAQAEATVSYTLGVAFGRWDIRYATGEKAAPELPDPFAPLPVCPPGQLQNAQSLPARPEDVPAAYPVRIPWDGILVDDPNHPLDIERRVREVIEIIWSGTATSHRASGATAEAIEHEACEILGVKSLRDYFRKPSGFFADHLKRYSKSRRQAPIYWPLATASGSYTLWIYYHRLTDQTLFQCVNDFVKPKIAEVEGDLSRLTTAGADKPGARVEIEHLTTLRAELVEFRDELLRVAQLPYKPNLNDGVLITASPLWKLFRLPKWQKDLKTCWQKLEKGEYDWAHLAYTIWPDRVKKVCKTDRSIAIAHGLEDMCEVKAAEKKAKRGKKKLEADDLV